jgi:hypothetical protein
MEITQQLKNTINVKNGYLMAHCGSSINFVEKKYECLIVVLLMMGILMPETC